MSTHLQIKKLQKLAQIPETNKIKQHFLTKKNTKNNKGRLNVYDTCHYLIPFVPLINKNGSWLTDNINYQMILDKQKTNIYQYQSQHDTFHIKKQHRNNIHGTKISK